MQCLALVGFMASGKTTIGRSLAKLLDFPFIDLDQEIVRVKGKTISEIFSESGENTFRKYEREVLQNISIHRTKLVLATGGGTITQEIGRNVLKQNYYVVYLDVAIETALLRIQKDGRTRPLANDASGVGMALQLENLFLTRRPLYESVAEFSCKIQNQSSELVAAEIVAHLQQDPHWYKP
jgi:shikimate kinase